MRLEMRRIGAVGIAGVLQFWLGCSAGPTCRGEACATPSLDPEAGRQVVVNTEPGSARAEGWPPAPDADGAAAGGSASLCADGPVLSGAYQIQSQADIDALFGCESIDGELVVQVFPDADWAPVASLRAVTGSVSLSGGPEPRVLEPLGLLEGLESVGALSLSELEFPSLEPLAQLRIAGELGISFCHGFADLRGLELLTARVVRLQQLPDLVSLQGLGASLSALHIGVTSIATLHGLEAVTGLEALSLASNPELVSLVGWNDASSLTSLTVAGNARLERLELPSSPAHLTDVSIVGNPLLAGLSGFETTVTLSRLDLASNDALTDLSGFAGLGEVESLSVRESAALTSLSGLGNLVRADYIQLWGNDNLLDLTGLGSLVEVGGLEIDGSSSNLSKGGIDTPPRLASLAGLDALRRVGRLYIARSPALLSLSGFEHVTELDTLELDTNENLASLAGLVAPVAMQRVELSFCPALTDITALEPLREVREELRIRDTGVAQLDALQNLRTVGSLSVYENLALLQIDGLANLEGVGNLFLSSDPLLRVLPTFARLIGPGFDPALPYAGLSLTVSELPSLESGPSFPLLAAAGLIDFNSNSALTRLSGLPALVAVGALTIERNRQLADVDLPALARANSLKVRANPALGTGQLSRLEQLGATSELEVSAGALAPCPWILDAECDELMGTCAPGTDPVCRL